MGDIDRMAKILMDAWAKAEPNHGITKHPTSYVATFADMARAALDAAEARAVGVPVAWRTRGMGLHDWDQDWKMIDERQAAIWMVDASYRNGRRQIEPLYLHPASPLGAVAMKAAAVAKLRREWPGPAAQIVEAIPTTFTDAELLAAAAEVILQHALSEPKEDKEDPLIAGAVIPWLQGLAAMDLEKLQEGKT